MNENKIALKRILNNEEKLKLAASAFNHYEDGETKQAQNELITLIEALKVDVIIDKDLRS